jgi:hypothetical protein
MSCSGRDEPKSGKKCAKHLDDDMDNDDASRALEVSQCSILVLLHVWSCIACSVYAA